MQRRALLPALVTAALPTLLPGCLSVLDTGYPDRVSSVEFDRYEHDDPGYDAAPGVREPPSVAFHPGESAAVVRGAFLVGSSECNRVAFDGLSMTGNRLDVDVGTETVDQNDGPVSGCSGDEHAEAYRLRIVFDDELPAAVGVSESDGTTTTVER
jgi:hypothetical protein